MLSPTEKEKTLMFLALMQAVYEMADDVDFTAKPFNKPIIRERTWELTHTLNKQISKILPMNELSEEWDRAVAQHIDASERMVQFFTVGLRLQKLDPLKVQGFDTQLNILLKTYGVE